MHGEMTHKYLGLKFLRDLNTRSGMDFTYRTLCAWDKFHQHDLILLDKHVSFRSRSQLFHATECPTAMFHLALLPLTQRFLHKLDVMQRQVLRSTIVTIGWVRIPEEPSRNTRMKNGARCVLHPLPSWGNRHFTTNTVSPEMVSNHFFVAGIAIAWMPLMIGCTTFHPLHPEAGANRPKAWG